MSVNGTVPGTGMGKVGIVAALSCELKPFSEALGHGQVITGPGGIKAYTARKGGPFFIVSGIGQLAMASALGWAAAHPELAGGRRVAWLNVGTAGHADLPLGTVVWAGQLRTDANDPVLYPTAAKLPPHAPQHHVVSLRTVAVPERSFSDQCAYDMEGYAFFQCASRFTAREAVALIKVVSDHAATPTASLTRARLTELMTGAFDLVRCQIAALEQLADDLQDMTPLAPDPRMLARWRFSTTRVHQLQAALARFRIHHPDIDPMTVVDRCPHASAVISTLTEHCNGAAPLGRERVRGLRP